MVINSRYISRIRIDEDLYVIEMIPSKIDGFFFFQYGSLSVPKREIHVWRKDHQLDYKSVSDFLSKLF